MSLLTPEDFAEVNAALDAVTDTFLKVAVTVFYKLRPRYLNDGEESLDSEDFLQFNVNALPSAMSNGEVDVRQTGKYPDGGRQFMIATKDYLTALQTAITAYNLTSAGIRNPAPAITLAAGYPSNYVDAACMRVREAGYGDMDVERVSVDAVWDTTHKLLYIQARQNNYVKVQ